jgi:SAM-dependent methyltransferase
MIQENGQDYLIPYQRAAAVHGAGFGSLLWASPQTQAARFDAFARLWRFKGQSVLDVGCGRADFLEFLTGRGMAPADYVGIEAVAELAEAAERKLANSSVPSTLLRADFVREPAKMFVGADVIVFSGALNTLPDDSFYQTLRFAWDAAASGVLFNFLDSPSLAAARYLHWRRPADVLGFAHGLAGTRVRTLHDYLEGDYTIEMRRKEMKNDE